MVAPLWVAVLLFSGDTREAPNRLGGLDGFGWVWIGVDWSLGVTWHFVLGILLLESDLFRDLSRDPSFEGGCEKQQWLKIMGMNLKRN